jgi:hypothetical protein
MDSAGDREEPREGGGVAVGGEPRIGFLLHPAMDGSEEEGVSLANTLSSAQPSSNSGNSAPASAMDIDEAAQDSGEEEEEEDEVGGAGAPMPLPEELRSAARAMLAGLQGMRESLGLAEDAALALMLEVRTAGGASTSEGGGGNCPVITHTNLPALHEQPQFMISLASLAWRV